MIDLRSDTVTKPSEAMRQAMASAEVGDDVYGEDPTVNRLQEKGAALLGKAVALFVPSGTMANQLALRAQAPPGQEVIVESRCHMIRYEQGAGAALAGVQFHWIVGERGIMTPEQVEAAIRPKDSHTIQTALICVENTHNSGGGTIYPLATIERIGAIARQRGLPTHMAGAPSPFERQKDTVVKCFAYSVAETPVATTALKSRAPSMCVGRPRCLAMAPIRSMVARG
jgi:threonine aldolase